MKKYLPIFLAFQILAASSPNNQGVQAIVKMGTFFHHFAHHVICHQESISIASFVKLHYCDNEHDEEDHAEHKNHPFHHHHNNSNNQQNLGPQMPYLLPQRFAIVAFPKLVIISNPLIFRSQQWHSSSFSGDIWQPPKA